MHILITGATGRIGANLVRRLLPQGHTIRGFTYPGDASRAHKLDGFDNVDLVEGDLRDRAAVGRAVAGVDAIVHLAAAFGGPYDNVGYLEVNGLGTLHLLEAVRETVPDLKRFVYASTEAIYWSLSQKGRHFEKPVREEDVSSTHQMPYFLTKWIGEELCMNYHVQYGIPSVACRFATVFEPSEFLSEDGVPNFCALAGRIRQLEASDPDEAARLRNEYENGARLLISRGPTGRTWKQEWADVRDIAKGLALALEEPKAVGETFTLGGILTNWEEDVPKLAERLRVGHAESRRETDNFFEFDHTKVDSLLGYQPDHDLWSTLDTALAIREGKETDVIPTGIRYGTT